MILKPDEEKKFRKVHHRIPYTGEILPDYEGALFMLGPILNEADEDAVKQYFDRFDLQILRRDEKVFLAQKRNKKFIFVVTAPGSPEASRDFERYFCHSSADVGIGIGKCGGLQNYIERGDVIIPRSAIVGEGTSRYYEDNDLLHQGLVELNREMYHTITPDYRQLGNYLWRNLKKTGLKIYEGEVFTTDVPFMETPEFVNGLKEGNVLGIEMETSSFITVSNYHKKKSAVALFVEDNQTNNHDIYYLWPPKDARMHRKGERTNLPLLVEAATETLLEYI